MDNLKNKKIYLWLIFSLSLFVILFDIVFCFTIVTAYISLKGEGPYTILYWLSFFTHWSNILVCVWATYELINIYWLKNESKNTYLKQLTFSTIILTGIIAFPILWARETFNDMLVLFQLSDLKDWDSSQLHFSQELFVTIDALITTLFHVVIPLLCFFYFIKNGKLSKEMSKEEEKRNLLFNLLYISIYFIWVLILTSLLNTQNPYPFEDFGNYNKWYVNLEALAINIFIGLLFIVINIKLVSYNNKFYKDK